MLNLREAWQARRFSVLISEPLLDEVSAILTYPRIQKFLSEERREELLHRLERLGEPITCVEPYPEAPDPADDFLFAMLRDGDADLLVTGDGLLLKAEHFRGKPITKVAAFLGQLEK